MYDLETNKYFVSRDVQFFENQFPCLVSLLDEEPLQWEKHFASPPAWNDESYDAMDGLVIMSVGGSALSDGSTNVSGMEDTIVVPNFICEQVHEQTT